MMTKAITMCVALVVLSFSSVASSQLCPQVSLLEQGDEAFRYGYEYGAPGAGDNADDPYWVGAPVGSGGSDFGDALFLDEIYVTDESEGLIGGSFANWHVQVTPFYLPANCRGLRDVGATYDCVWASHDQRRIVQDFYWWWETESSFGAIAYHTFVPGPYDAGDLCEWRDVSSLGRHQHVDYSNFVLWDWDALCFPPGSAQHRRFCSDKERCFTGRGCADGVIMVVWESDEGFGDDRLFSITVLRNHRGHLVARPGRYARYVRFHNHLPPSPRLDTVSPNPMVPGERVVVRGANLLGHVRRTHLLGRQIDAAVSSDGHSATFRVPDDARLGSGEFRIVVDGKSASIGVSVRTNRGGGTCAACSSSRDCGDGFSCRRWRNFPEVTWCSRTCASDQDCRGEHRCVDNACIPRQSQVCDGDEVWLQDACGHRLRLEERCATGDVCRAGECAALPGHCEPCDQLLCGPGTVCAGYGSGEPICTARCDRAPCPSGWTCGSNDVCRPTDRFVCQGPERWQTVCDLPQRVRPCEDGQACVADGMCTESCVPDCAGRECGPDPLCGISCGGCHDGECADGECRLIDDAPRAVGEPCLDGGECASGVCIEEAGGPYVDGYCTAPCGPETPCPAGASCYEVGSGSDAINRCFDDCTSRTDCRNQYGCYAVPRGSGACIPCSVGRDTCPAEDLCRDGIDNDGDGQVDEDCGREPPTTRVDPPAPDESAASPMGSCRVSPGSLVGFPVPWKSLWFRRPAGTPSLL